MTVAPLAVEIICVGFLAAILLHRYGNWRKQHLLVTLTTFTSWYFCLMIVFVLPLDVSSTYYRQCLLDNKPISPATTTIPNTTTLNNANFRSGAATVVPINQSTTAPPGPSSATINPQGSCGLPWSHVPDYILPTLWRVVYWTSQVLTWLVLPMMQSYANAGAFTVLGKLKTALIENAIFYGSYLLVFIIILVYVAASPDLELDASQLKVIGITASNTWGLFLLVLLLGYGLVDAPRILWYSSNIHHMLSQTQFKAAKLSTEKSEAEEDLEDVLEDIKKASEAIKYNHPLRKNIDTILCKCPDNFRKSVQHHMDDYEDYESPTDIPTEKSLVKLHRKIITVSLTHRRTQVQWERLLEEAFEYEDILTNQRNHSGAFRRAIQYEAAGLCKMYYGSRLEWFWKCVLRSWVYKLACVISCILSFMVVWSEVIFFIEKPVLSLFAIFVQLAASHHNYLYIEIACCLTISYLCLCAYYTVFKIRVFNYYYISPHHQTDANSLLFSGMLLCRLTPPLCLNFLGMIHLDSHITHDKFNRSLAETFYTQIMGHMDVISFISDGFNIYFPIAIVLLCIATLFHLGSRCLHCLGFQQFIGDDDMTQELIDEGRELIKRERRRIERRDAATERKKVWDDKFGYLRSANTDTSDSERERRPKKIPRGLKPSRYGESDRSELLASADPIDFTGNESIEDLQNGLTQDYNSIQDNLSRPTDYRGTREDSRPGRFSINRPSAKKGIFDDV